MAADLDGITTRLGVRVYGVSDAIVKPDAAVKWWHGPDDSEVAFDGTGIKLDLQRSADDYSDARLQVGLNYSW